MNKIFLGGTCAESTWREELIKNLHVSYFNPVVEDWTEEMQAIEEDEKTYKCTIHLYVITKEMKGVFSIAEAVESVFNKSKRTIFFVIEEGFEEFQIKSLKAVEKLILNHGGIIKSDTSETIEDLADFLNSL